MDHVTTLQKGCSPPSAGVRWSLTHPTRFPPLACSIGGDTGSERSITKPVRLPFSSSQQCEWLLPGSLHPYSESADLFLPPHSHVVTTLDQATPQVAVVLGQIHAESYVVLHCAQAVSQTAKGSDLDSGLALPTAAVSHEVISVVDLSC